jgi:DNA-binding XRE family transcriptional regulator
MTNQISGEVTLLLYRNQVKICDSLSESRKPLRNKDLRSDHSLVKKRDVDLKIIGERFRKLRASFDMTQEELEAKSKVTQGTISGIENGKQKPNPATLSALAGGLNIGFESLKAFIFEGKPLPMTIMPDQGNSREATR